jgi:ATP-dependent Lhr-like helicase
LLKDLAVSGRLLEGEFRPGGTGREWCDPDVLQTVRRRSLAKLRRQVEPVEPPVLGRLITTWQGVVRRRPGLDALLDAIDNLQGLPLPASIFEGEILAARVEGYNPADLDTLTAAGEVVWAGLEPLGERDGRLGIYLTDKMSRLHKRIVVPEPEPREHAILDFLGNHGASFFSALHEATGGGYPGETVDALWDLVWKGAITNDTFHALRAFTRPPERRRKRPAALTRSLHGDARRPGGRPFVSRRAAPASAEGRWSLVSDRLSSTVTTTEWSTALAQQLLSRYGVLTREVAGAEGISGGFSAVYDVLKAMEDAGRIRRGYFVSGVGATQFALPAALDLLRSLKELPEEPEVVLLAATDPANPYGTILGWPAGSEGADAGRGPTRSVGALVVLVNGALSAYISRGARQLQVFLPEDEPARSVTARALARRLAGLGLLIGEINGVPAPKHPLAPFLVEAGFSPSAMGFHVRRTPSPLIPARSDDADIAGRAGRHA